MTASGTSNLPPASSIPSPGGLTGQQRGFILAAAFLAWMFAGLELSMFALAGRQAATDLLGAGGAKPPPDLVAKWFTYYQGAIMLGAAAGGWMFGWLGDGFGRTRAMAWSILWYSLMTGFSYAVNGPSQLLILRFAVGMGIGGVWPNAVSLVAEAWPNASRPFLAGLLGTAANFGFVLLGAIGYLWPISADSWRWVPLVGTIPILCGLWVLFSVAESPKWLIARGAAAARAAAVGGDTEKKFRPMAEVLTPPLLRRTVIGVLLGAIPVIGTAANGNWLTFWSGAATESTAKPSAMPPAAASVGVIATTTAPAIPSAGAGATRPTGKPALSTDAARKAAMTQMLRSGGGIFGSLLGGWIASLLGRRVTYFLISLFALATSTIIFGFTHPTDPHFGWLTFALGFIGVTYFGWLPLYLPELFPTRVRSTGTGISFNSGRVIAALVTLGASLLIVYFKNDPAGMAKVGLATGFVYALGMLIICFAPSTGGKKLED